MDAKQKIEKGNNIKLGSEKVREREIKIKVIQISLLIMLMLLFVLYFLLKIIYEAGNFTVTLDENFSQKSGIVMYENSKDKEEKRQLAAEQAKFIDNISVDWLPENINETGEGSHNGENYLAYTFYVANQGSSPIHYWYEIAIDDVIKNVDKAIRVMVFENGEKTIYAKPNETTGNSEKGTSSFRSDTQVVLKQRKDFKPGDEDKYTIVVFLEGDDPDCTDALIGGEIKMHMDITEEHFIE